VLDPAAISLIASVDVNAINAAAQRIQAAGQDIDTAGRRINTAWGGLGAVYHAPEAGQLYAAMNPVQQQASEFSRQADEVAAALRFFAAEAAQLKARAHTLAGMIQHFNTWSSHHNHIWDNLSSSKTDTETQLQADATNLQVAWWQAQTRCANRINALDGGPHYIPAPPSGANPVLAIALGALGQQYYGYTSIPDGMDAGWGTTDHSAQPWWEQALGHLLNTNPAISYQHLILGQGDAAFHMIEGTWDLTQPLSPRFLDAWKGVALLGIATSPLLSTAAKRYAPNLNKQAGQALTNFGKSFVYADDWRKDPAKAIGGLSFNLATLQQPETRAGDLGDLGRLSEASRISEAANAGHTLTGVEQATRAAELPHFEIPAADNLTDFTNQLHQLNTNHQAAPIGSGHDIPVQLRDAPHSEAAPALTSHPTGGPQRPTVGELNDRLKNLINETGRPQENAFATLDQQHGGKPLDPREPALNKPGDPPAESGALTGKTSPHGPTTEPRTAGAAKTPEQEPALVGTDKSHISDPRTASGSGTDSPGEDRLPRVTSEHVDPAGKGSSGASPITDDLVTSGGAHSTHPSQTIGGDSGDLSASQHGHPPAPQGSLPPGADEATAATGGGHELRHVEVNKDSPLAPKKTKPFGAGVELEPKTRYQVIDASGDDRGVFITDENGQIREIHTTSGRVGQWNPDLRRPLSSAVYHVDGHRTYYTDAESRTYKARGELHPVGSDESRRMSSDQRNIGWEGRNEYRAHNKHLLDQFRVENHRDPLPGEIIQYQDVNWNGGHFIGTEYGGAGERLNVTPMLETLNQAQKGTSYLTNFRRLEMHWNDLLSQNKRVFVEIEAKFEPGAKAPRYVKVKYWVDGKPQKVIRFKNIPPKK
jgi:uncharacterized protein YukE